MTGGLSQAARVYASLDAEPIHDRWHRLGEAIEQHGRDIDLIQTQHRLDMIARWGLPDDHFEKGPAR